MEGGLCFCGLPARRSISWTNLNPGRRFWSCSRFRGGQGCNFSQWIDPPMRARGCEVIPGLLRRIEAVKAIELRRKEREQWMWVVTWVIVYLLL